MSSNVDPNSSEAEEERKKTQHRTFISQGHSWSGNERNCLFLNNGGTQFSTASYVTGFDFKDDSRGIALVDWDHDGDLDIWMSNRHKAQARYLENQSENTKWISLKAEGDGQKINRNAIGTSFLFWIEEEGKQVPLKRNVHCSGSFLSQSSQWINVGLGSGKLLKIEVKWPDGTVQTLPAPKANQHYTLKFGEHHLRPWSRPSHFQLSFTPLKEPSLPALGTRFIYNYPLPPLPLFSETNKRAELPSNTIQFLLFWSADCSICANELKHIAQAYAAFKKKGIEFTLINVDIDSSGEPLFNKATSEPIKQLSTNSRGIENIERFIDMARSSHATFSTPLGMLLDEKSNILSFYEGKMNPELVIRDTKLSQASIAHRHWNTIPFKGIFNGRHTESLHDVIAVKYGQMGYSNHAAKVLQQSPAKEKETIGYQLELSAIYLRANRPQEAIPILQTAIKTAITDRDKRVASRNLGLAYLNTRQYKLAEQQLSATAKTYQDAQSYHYLAKTALKRGRHNEVEGHLLKSIQLCEKQELAFSPPFKSLASAYKRAGRHLELQDILARAKALRIDLQKK